MVENHTNCIPKTSTLLFSDIPEDDGDDADDDCQDSERLLATDWYKTLQFNDL